MELCRHNLDSELQIKAAGFFMVRCSCKFQLEKYQHFFGYQGGNVFRTHTY